MSLEQPELARRRDDWVSEHLEILPYDAHWPRAFESERERIALALAGVALRIDHKGSTAVVGLAAKPVIDIQISVRRLHPLTAYAGQLAGLGYRHLAHPDDSFCPFFYRPGDWPHTHHIHVVESGGEEERRTLAFRDYLREHESIAEEYEELKRRLAPQYGAAEFSSRQAYAHAKGEFINCITRLAIEAGHPRNL